MFCALCCCFKLLPPPALPAEAAFLARAVALFWAFPPPMVKCFWLVGMKRVEGWPANSCNPLENRHACVQGAGCNTMMHESQTERNATVSRQAQRVCVCAGWKVCACVLSSRRRLCVRQPRLGGAIATKLALRSLPHAAHHHPTSIQQRAPQLATGRRLAGGIGSPVGWCSVGVMPVLA